MSKYLKEANSLLKNYLKTNEFKSSFVGLDIENIKNDVKDILTSAIKRNVYDVYDPKEYVRTNELLNSVDVDYNKTKNELFVYVNTEGFSHYSIWSGDKVGKWIPYWIQNGHYSNRYNLHMFYQYPNVSGDSSTGGKDGRDYLGLAKAEIEAKYGCRVEIVNTEPK